MFDKDIVELYGVETRVLNQVVKRNLQRFRFQLSEDEYKKLKSQIVMSSFKQYGGSRHVTELSFVSISAYFQWVVPQKLLKIKALQLKARAIIQNQERFRFLDSSFRWNNNVVLVK
jgi:hypothetical protein